ncbi:hypothetical protein ABT202_12355 [Streptomyces sp900105245]|uniref:hypothetical protein n=1 Tax=Streptomyces sp. 900105245 TaxID=3154379 RepID=UPI003328476B
MGNGQDTKLYARDPAHHFQAGTQPSRPLPQQRPPTRGNHDTGHRSTHRQPWLTHTKTKAYNRTTDRVEARPQAKTGTTCK